MKTDLFPKPCQVTLSCRKFPRCRYHNNFSLNLSFIYLWIMLLLCNARTGKKIQQKNNSIHLKQMQSSHVVFISAIQCCTTSFPIWSNSLFSHETFIFSFCAAVVSLNRFTMGLVIEQLHINCNLPKKIEKIKLLNRLRAHYTIRDMYTT